MAYVKVILIAEGQSYTVEVDENADPKKLARGFAQKLGKPSEEYRISLVGALRIQEGATLRLERIEDNELFRNLKPGP
jgi:hypothetical protein